MLYIVATPIGNLKDISQRARDVLEQADVIAAEDTRRTQALLHSLGIQNQTIAYHAHNEHGQTERMLETLLSGKSVALVSDAGTPLISDPGYLLVKAARERDIPVIPIPGPSALIAALSVSGLPTDQFFFKGFLPHKSGPRQRMLQTMVNLTGTLVFYESPHRLLDSLGDMLEILGDRQVVMARELTKQFETVLSDNLSGLIETIKADPNQQKGEFVLMVSGVSDDADQTQLEGERVRDILLTELPLKQASSLAAKITGASKNKLYKGSL